MATSGDNNQYDDERVVTTKDLEVLLGLGRSTQLNYMSKPEFRHRMPPDAFKRPGSREWLWKLGGVLAWRDSGNRAEPPVPLPPSAPRDAHRPKGSLGKKRRVEQIEAAKAGMQPRRPQGGLT